MGLSRRFDCGSLRQSFLKEVALVVGGPVKFAETLETKLSIKSGGLKAEGVDISRVAAALQRSVLGFAHQLAADALAA